MLALSQSCFHNLDESNQAIKPTLTLSQSCFHNLDERKPTVKLMLTLSQVTGNSDERNLANKLMLALTKYVTQKLRVRLGKISRNVTPSKKDTPKLIGSHPAH
jgi:hypothetical protein